MEFTKGRSGLLLCVYEVLVFGCTLHTVTRRSDNTKKSISFALVFQDYKVLFPPPPRIVPYRFMRCVRMPSGNRLFVTSAEWPGAVSTCR